MTFTLAGQMKSGKNRVLITRKGHRYAPKPFTIWREACLKQLSQQVSAYARKGACLPLQSTITLECEYTPGDARTRDVDGMLGALMHLIVKAGLVVDDGQVWGVTWRREAMDRKQPGLTFTITTQEGI